MNVIYHKLWSDLWRHRLRTSQTVLVIAMGAFAIGMIIGGRNLTVAAITEVRQRSSPPMIMMWVRPAIDDNQLAALKNIEGVSEVEGLLMANIE